MPVVLPEHDVRRKRPPVLMFLLRVETLRRLTRVLTLLMLDFVGVTAAIFTAITIKLALRGDFRLDAAWSNTRTPLAFAYLLTVLMFARLDLYADRPRRPGLPKIFAGLFQATVIALIFALATGNHFKSYYIFYGALLFGTVYISVLRECYTRFTGWVLEQAGYRRRALLVGSGQHIEEVAHALGGRSRTQVDLVGYISLTPRPQNGLRSLGRLDELSDVLGDERIDEVIIADPDFPQERALDLVDRCHQRGVTVHVAPSTMEILIDRAVFVPGESVPLFTLRPPVFDGVQFAAKRTFDLTLSTVGLVLLSPVLAAIAVAVKLSSPGPVIYRSVRPGMGGKPFRCFKFRTMREHAGSDPGRPRAPQRALRRPVQDPRGPAADHGGPLPAPLLPGRAAPAGQRHPRRDVAGGPAPAADARLRAPRGLAQEALPRHARDHRPVAGLRPRRAGLRRSGAPGLPVPGAVVDPARPLDPGEDHSGCALAPRRVLARRVGARAR